MRRIIYSLSRPSRLGLFLKDSILIPLIHVLVFFGAVLALRTIETYNTNHFVDTPREARIFIENNLEDSNIEFDGLLLTGDETKIAGSDITIYFNKTDLSVVSTSILIINYRDTYFNIYYGVNKAKINYEDCTLQPFKLNELKGNITAELNLERLLTVTFNSVEDVYRASILPNIIFQSFIQYVIVLALLVIFARFANPNVDFIIRFKLSLYDSLIYLLFEIFSVCFNITYLFIVGAFVAFIYCYRTMSKIIRVDSKGVPLK